MRVAAAGIARKWLAERYGVRIFGYLSGLGPFELGLEDREAVGANPFFCGEPDRVPELEEYMQRLRKDLDSVGARVTVFAEGCPAGWGEPVFDRLDADLAHALMSINAVKAVEIGAGVEAARQRGTEHRDEITPDGFLGNSSGGVLGGITTGQDVVASIALTPPSSIVTPGRSIDTTGQPVEVVTKGRHDPCVGIRAVPIAEAMLALTLMDHALRHRGQNADVVPPFPGVPGSPGQRGE